MITKLTNCILSFIAFCIVWGFWLYGITKSYPVAILVIMAICWLLLLVVGTNAHYEYSRWKRETSSFRLESKKLIEFLKDYKYNKEDIQKLVAMLQKGGKDLLEEVK